MVKYKVKYNDVWWHWTNYHPVSHLSLWPLLWYIWFLFRLGTITITLSLILSSFFAYVGLFSCSSFLSFWFMKLSLFPLNFFKWANPGLFLFIFVLFWLQFQFKLKKARWCAWDSNPGPQDGRRWRNHWASQLFFVLIVSLPSFYLCYIFLLFFSLAVWPDCKVRFSILDIYNNETLVNSECLFSY